MQINAQEGEKNLNNTTKLRALTQVPYFNATIYLENKTQVRMYAKPRLDFFNIAGKVGKVEEIFGPVNNTVSVDIGVSQTRLKFGTKMFTVKLLEGINAISYEKGSHNPFE